MNSPNPEASESAPPERETAAAGPETGPSPDLSAPDIAPGDDRYSVRVENIFEGPMDLLVYLIKKNEVDIWDIPIAPITEEYLSYLDVMTALNVDMAGEFILMASTLTQIKSRMLLPVHDAGDGEEMEDPRLALARPLAEYMRIKEAAERLAGFDLLGEDVFPSRPDTAALAPDPGERGIKASLFDLVDAFRVILDRMSLEHRMAISHERFTLQDRIAWIVDILEKQGSVVFHELFETAASKEEMIVTFLAVLELARLNVIEVAQQVHCGIIRLFYV